MVTSIVPPDPLESPLWDAMVENNLQGLPIVFDPAIVVGLPPVTEDQTQVPIIIDARKLGSGVEELIVLGDLNPFPVTLKMRPTNGPAFVAFRMRVEQGTAIRGAARVGGKWHVGAAYLDAAGGGCSAPPVTESKVDWDHLGQMRAKLWREDADTLRLRVRMIHPMDTGLHKEPAFFIEALAVRDAAGGALVDFEVPEPIGANPTFTMLLRDPKAGDHVGVFARDTDGHKFEAKVPMVRMASTAPIIREGRL